MNSNEHEKNNYLIIENYWTKRMLVLEQPK